MTIKVVGFRNVNFKDNASGNDISGTTVYFLYGDRNVDGYAVDKTFIGSGRINPFELNKTYSVAYNRYGKIDFDSVLEANK